MQYRAKVNILFGRGIYHHSTFSNTEEHSDGHEISKVTDNTSTRRYETECDDKQRKIILWPNLFEKNIGRDFDSCIWEEESSQCDIELGLARSGRRCTWYPTNPKSVPSPRTRALPILARSMKQARYANVNMGNNHRSNFHTSLLSASLSI